MVRSAPSRVSNHEARSAAILRDARKGGLLIQDDGTCSSAQEEEVVACVVSASFFGFPVANRRR